MDLAPATTVRLSEAPGSLRKIYPTTEDAYPTTLANTVVFSLDREIVDMVVVSLNVLFNVPKDIKPDA